jgi:hypothetical protein
MELHHSSGILLHEGRFSVTHGDGAQDCLCRVTFDLTRKYHVLIDCLESLHELFTGPSLPWFHPEQPFQVLVPGVASPIECHIFGSFRQQITGDDPRVYLTLSPLGRVTSIDSGSQLYRVNAGIANFGPYSVAATTIRLEGGTWVFELTPVEESRFLYPPGIQNDSYRFSQHLLLQRSDGGGFSSANARNALSALSTFLSFCAERWIAPVLIAGFDRSGNVAMEEWGTALVEPTGGYGGWLDEYHGGTMAEVFPGFSMLMEDPEWRRTIRTAVYWYVRADTDHVGPDGAIILIQTALERLAGHILVTVRHAISEEGFSKLAAADQLRLVLNACSVPLELPTLLTHSAAVATGQKGEPDWVDGPQAFVAVRNQIVHPGKRQRVTGGNCFFEALQLGKWYLELILLRCFDFSGSCACRLKIPRSVGDVEPVPWARLRT